MTKISPSGSIRELQIGTVKPQTETGRNQTVVEKIVYAVADAEGVSPTDLRPLITVIDPDSLESLFGDATKNVTVEFTYHGYHVHVSSDEQVTVSAPRE